MVTTEDPDGWTQPAGFDQIPAPWADGGLRVRLHRDRMAAGRRLVVFDDDPTGSQSVRDVSLVTTPSIEAARTALAPDGAVMFALTNSRSLPQHEAHEVTRSFAEAAFTAARELGVEVDVISRSDSMLRGHLWDDLDAVQTAAASVLDLAFDAILVVPAFFEAGRVTVNRVHYLHDPHRPAGHQYLPVARTEFARDATFGYSQSDLAAFLQERTGGRVPADSVQAVTLQDIRDGGPEHVAQILRRVHDGGFVVVDALAYADLDVVAHAVALATQSGHRVLWRTAPSAVAAIAGQGTHPPLSAHDVAAAMSSGSAAETRESAGAPRHGLIVVGSHTQLTTSQVEAVLDDRDVHVLELSVPALLDDAPTGRQRAIDDAVAAAARALSERDVLIMTTRDVHLGVDPVDSLRIARAVSAGLSAVVAGLRQARPAWVVAKGGITSHDVAVDGLGIEVGTVLGQLLPGMLTVLQPQRAPDHVRSVPYVIFAGNVGDSSTLATALRILREVGTATPSPHRKETT